MTAPAGVVGALSAGSARGVVPARRVGGTRGVQQPLDDGADGENGSAAITAAPTPAWLRTETSACTASAACDGAAQEVQTATTYQAGSASAGSNLLPLAVTSGSGDGALAATTTTVWDAAGDVLTVDGPLPGPADTTRSVYDAMRQVVGVIGPDPDGAGPRLFPATRTAYDPDGRPTQVERGTTPGQSDAAWAAFAPLQADRSDLKNSR